MSTAGAVVKNAGASPPLPILHRPAQGHSGAQAAALPSRARKAQNIDASERDPHCRPSHHPRAKSGLGGDLRIPPGTLPVELPSAFLSAAGLSACTAPARGSGGERPACREGKDIPVTRKVNERAAGGRENPARLRTKPEASARGFCARSFPRLPKTTTSDTTDCPANHPSQQGGREVNH